MIRLDIAYIKRASLLLDVVIALKTVPAIAAQVKEGYARWAQKRPVEYA